MSARVTAALAVALLIAGGAFDSPSLYVPGVALAALAGAALAWGRLASRGARVERLPGPAAVAEGQPYPVRLRVRAGLVPPRGEVRDPLLPRPLPLAIRDGARSRTAELLLDGEARFAGRGRQRLDPPRLVVRDPLRLFDRRLEGGGGGEVLVLPRIEPVRAGRSAGGEDAEAAHGPIEGSGSGPAPPRDTDVEGLRPYRKGSPASRIHWPAVARHGDLIERRLASGGEGRPLVVLDAERPASPAALDRAVRAAASLCVHLARNGGCALLVGGASRPLPIDFKLRGWRRAHVHLALVEPGDGVRGIRRLGDRQTTFWVTAEEPRAASRMGIDARAAFLVTPSPPAGGRSSFTVAGCHGRPLAAGGRARAAA
jgi:uncharacterized protein (DUF58 family)